MSLFDHKITELNQLTHNTEIKIYDLVDQSYIRIQSVDDKVQAILALDEERARVYANLLDEEVDGRSE
ncbi:Asp-tRNA(Asn)/Glu-tRNA(Gln) amidotransferase subunit GatA, partial [Bacillus subtilis]